ncbi:MAG: biotin/lipoyl-containing protein [Candidatus Eisenbacteria bacterium]
MKFWVTLEGREAEVDFRTEGERVWLEVEGRRLEADFRRLPDGEVYSLLIEGRSHEVRIAAGRGVLDVTLDGTMFPVEVRHPLEKLLQSAHKATGATAGETVTAPMPGLVVAIKVGPGDTVVAGQPVVVVEAMKMQNELTARHDGVVREVLVADRATVSAGQALIRIGPVS